MSDDILDKNVIDAVKTYNASPWVYKAHVTRVIDGDTVEANVDLGFRTYQKLMFRLADIDAHEIRGGTAETKILGQQEKTELEYLVLGHEVTIHTNKTGKYGRWIARIFWKHLDVNEHMKRIIQLNKERNTNEPT